MQNETIDNSELQCDGLREHANVTEAAPRELPPETIAAWLGIPVDGTFQAHNNGQRYVAYVTLGVVAAAALSESIDQIAAAGEHMLAALVSPALIIGALVFAVCYLPRLYADVAGIVFERRHRSKQFAWADLRAAHLHVRGRLQFMTAETTRGEFRFRSNSGSQWQLARVIQQVLDARAQGFEPPNEPPLPSGALSAPSLDSSPDAERGLSPSENKD